MPHRSLLPTSLADTHEALGRFLTDDARFTVETVIRTLITDAANLKLPLLAVPELRRAAETPSYFRTNVRQEVVEVTDPLLKLLDLAYATDLLGYAWYKYLVPTEERRRLERWMVAAQDHKAFLHTFLFQAPGGRHLTIQEWVMPMRDPLDGVTLIGWFSFVQSVAKVVKITEARRREMAAPDDDEAERPA